MTKLEREWTKRIEIWWILRDIKKKKGYKKSDISWGSDGSCGSITLETDIRGSHPYVRFGYIRTDNSTGKEEHLTYKSKLLSTPCNFGGVRYWFECPLTTNGKACKKRVGVLYQSGKYFGCRHCHRITYSSRNINRRNILFNSMKTIMNETRIDDLSRLRRRRHYYAGNPTRYARQIQTIHKEIAENGREFISRINEN